MSDVSVAELARQVQAAMTRLEQLARDLQERFITSQVFGLMKENIDNKNRSQDKDIADLETAKADKSALGELEKRVSALEDDKKWLTRLVGGVIILAIVGLLFAVRSFGVPQ
jgi:hypothetical protein